MAGPKRTNDDDVDMLYALLKTAGPARISLHFTNSLTNPQLQVNMKTASTAMGIKDTTLRMRYTRFEKRYNPKKSDKDSSDGDAKSAKDKAGEDSDDTDNEAPEPSPDSSSKSPTAPATPSAKKTKGKTGTKAPPAPPLQTARKRKAAASKVEKAPRKTRAKGMIILSSPLLSLSSA